MPPSASEAYYGNRELTRVAQGDIIRELKLSIISKHNDTEHQLSPSFSYGVVLTQECDIEQHYLNLEKNSSVDKDEQKFDKVLESLLVCPAFAADALIQGEHITDRPMNDFEGATGQKRALKKLKKNDVYERYHFLPALDGKFPDLIVDFKRFYTLPIGVFESQLESIFITSIKDLFRERLSQRFTNFLGRIGLPAFEFPAAEEEG